ATQTSIVQCFRNAEDRNKWKRSGAAVAKENKSSSITTSLSRVNDQGGVIIDGESRWLNYTIAYKHAIHLVQQIRNGYTATCRSPEPSRLDSRAHHAQDTQSISAQRLRRGRRGLRLLTSSGRWGIRPRRREHESPSKNGVSALQALPEPRFDLACSGRRSLRFSAL
ncbi:jg27388, partial [Pararge aegeria aegeria]